MAVFDEEKALLKAKAEAQSWSTVGGERGQ
jgi:hypothetical protein